MVLWDSSNVEWQGVGADIAKITDIMQGQRVANRWERLDRSLTCFIYIFCQGETNMEKCVCANCGSEIYKYKSEIRPQNFCNIECLREYREKRRITRECKNCGRKFEVAASVISEKTNSSAVFCCRDCYTEYQKTLTGEKNNHYTRYKTQCKNCGKEIWQIPSRAQIYKGKFCSIKCRSEYMVNYVGGEKNCNWVGGHTHYRGDFEHMKLLYFKGVCKCAICDTDEKIHIHHIIPYRLTQDNTRDNLVPLCAKHHKIIESKTVKLLKDSSDYDSIRKTVKQMIAGERNANYQNEVV